MLAAVAGGIAVVVAAALFVPGLLNNDASDGSAKSGGARSGPALSGPPRAVDLRIPTTVKGWPRVTSGAHLKDLLQAKQAYARMTPDSVIAAYKDGTHPGAFIMVGRSNVPRSRQARLLTGLTSPFESGAHVTFRPESTDGYGGYNACAFQVEDGIPGTVCAFVDDHAFGYITMASQQTSGPREIAALRRQVEVPTTGTPVTASDGLDGSPTPLAG